VVKSFWNSISTTAVFFAFIGLGLLGRSAQAEECQH
jgi:hypothetical protein